MGAQVDSGGGKEAGRQGGRGGRRQGQQQWQQVKVPRLLYAVFAMPCRIVAAALSRSTSNVAVCVGAPSICLTVLLPVSCDRVRQSCS